jgi:negative regulator of sigma E activity
MNDAIKMQVSAFVDGELPDNEADLLLRRLSQDFALRQQVADYLAIGRAMRGDIQVSGIDSLRERLFAQLDDKSIEVDSDSEPTKKEVMVRPMVGFAIAATVALLAIFGLRQMGEPTVGDLNEQIVADDRTTEFNTEPPIDDVLRQYRMMHDVTALESGANGVSIRDNMIEYRQEYAASLASAEAASSADSDDETEDKTDDTDQTSRDGVAPQ